METAICPAHGSRYPWAQDCPECTKEARRLGMSVDRYYSNVRPFLASERLKDRPMTSEIKPEDVKLPEPVARLPQVTPYQVSNDGQDVVLMRSVPVFTADQVRAAVLEATMAERERCAKVCEQMMSQAVTDIPLKCAAAIRSGK